MSTPRNYRCSTCKKGFSSPDGLRSHCSAKRHQPLSILPPAHASPTSTQCPTCCKLFPSADRLASHCASKRHGPGIAMNVYCQLCRRGFKSLLGLESHMNALGHFAVNPDLVGRTSATTNVIGLDSTQNPSTYLDGRGEDPTDQVPPMDHAPPPVPTPTESNIGNPGVPLDGAQWTPLHPTRNLNCAFCTALFGSPSAVCQHIESGRHSITRHQVTAAAYAMNIVPDITIKRIEGPASFATAVETYVATPASFNGVGYQCHLCPQPPFKTLHSLNSHLNSAAHDDCKFECPRPKCKRKFKLTSAFLQHLEAGSCGLADIPEITGYFHDFSGQFSGLLTM